jgi:hypothetical protein
MFVLKCTVHVEPQPTVTVRTAYVSEKNTSVYTHVAVVAVIEIKEGRAQTQTSVWCARDSKLKVN